jgi:hypothetical protein
MAEVMLSLVSNPYDPFEQYDLWLNFDHHEGFDTAGLLARAVSVSDSMSEPDQDQAWEDAIDSIVANPSFAGMYKKVQRGNV